MSVCLFLWVLLGFFFAARFSVTREPDAVTYRIGSIKPVPGGQPVQVFQHRLGQAQVNSRTPHEDIVEAKRCTRGRPICAFSTLNCTFGGSRRVRTITFALGEAGRK